MKELVYATGTQADSEAKKDESTKKKRSAGFDISAITMMAIGAIKVLRETDLDDIFKEVVDLVKNRYLAMGLLLGYLVLLGVDEHD